VCADAPPPDAPLPVDVEAVARDRNLRVLEELYGLLTAGDFEAFLTALPIDISVAVPGTSQIAGQYEGGDEVAVWLRRRIELSGGTLRFDPPQSLAADSAHGYALVLEFAERGDRFLPILNVHVWHMGVRPDGDMSLYWITYPGEQYAWDGFWS
jgi:hypothetical protein